MVQYVDRDFAVISLDDTAQLTVIHTSWHMNEVFLTESEKLRTGMCLSVEVVEASCQELQGLPLVLRVHSTQRRLCPRSEDPKGLYFGKIVQGTVRTVKPTCVYLTLEDGTKGSVHVSEVMEPEEVCQGAFPTSSVKVGSTVTARVIGAREDSSSK